MDEKILHVQAYGDIENAQFSGVSEFGVVSLKTIADQLALNPDADEIVVHIHSRGGDVDEGFAIHDLLTSSGKKVTTIIEGLCASIATVIALAGTTRKMTANSSFFIHNPFTVGIGNADELEKTADLVRVEENKLIDFYQKKTGAPRADIVDMMKDETKMNPERALNLKFVTEIVQETQAKIYAKFHNKQTQKQLEMTTATKILNQLKAMLTTAGIEDTQTIENAKNLDMKLKDSEDMLTINTEADAPKVGDTVTKNGENVPDQEFTLEDGTVVKTDSDSKISEIVAVAPEAQASSNDEEMNKLKTELQAANDKIEALSTENISMKAAISENENAFKAIQNKIELLTASIGSAHKPEGQQTHFRKNGNEPVTDVNDAVKNYKAAANKRRMNVAVK